MQSLTATLKEKGLIGEIEFNIKKKVLFFIWGKKILNFLRLKVSKANKVHIIIM